MKVFRIYNQSKRVGAVVSESKEAADAYALGRYGAGSHAEPVAAKQALSASPVCVVFETKEILASSCNPSVRLTVVK